MKRFLLCLLPFALFLSCLGLARGQARAGKNPSFTSIYTDLNTQCHAAVKKVGEGQDMPLRCRGYGGYSIYISYSAANAWLSAEKAGMESIALTSTQINYDREKGRKVEWRLADGKPFAVILRVEGKLLIRGLHGFERISGEIDAAGWKANQMARDLADTGYFAPQN